MKSEDLTFPRVPVLGGWCSQRSRNMSATRVNTVVMKMERFSMDERTLLVRLINKYRDILEIKKTDAASNSAKLRSWLDIEKQYNSYDFVIKRNWKQLRKAWENIKCKRKRQLALNIHDGTRISGGPCTSTSTDVFPEADIAKPSLMKSEETCRNEDHRMTVSPRELTYDLLSEESEQIILAEQQLPSACLLTPGEGNSTCDVLNSEMRAQPQSRHASAERELEIRVESIKSLKDVDDEICWIKRRTAEMELRLKEIEVSKAEKLKELEVTMAENSLLHQRQLMALELRERRRHYHHLEEMRKREKVSLTSANVQQPHH